MDSQFTIEDFRLRARQARAEQPDTDAPIVRVSTAEYQALIEHAESRGPTVAARLRDTGRLGRYEVEATTEFANFDS